MRERGWEEAKQEKCGTIELVMEETRKAGKEGGRNKLTEAGGRDEGEEVV